MYCFLFTLTSWEYPKPYCLLSWKVDSWDFMSTISAHPDFQASFSLCIIGLNCQLRMHWCPLIKGAAMVMGSSTFIKDNNHTLIFKSSLSWTMTILLSLIWCRNLWSQISFYGSQLEVGDNGELGYDDGTTDCFVLF